MRRGVPSSRAWRGTKATRARHAARARRPCLTAELTRGATTDGRGSAKRHQCASARGRDGSVAPANAPSALPRDKDQTPRWQTTAAGRRTDRHRGCQRHVRDGRRDAGVTRTQQGTTPGRGGGAGGVRAGGRATGARWHPRREARSGPAHAGGGMTVAGRPARDTTDDRREHTRLLRARLSDRARCWRFRGGGPTARRRDDAQHTTESSAGPLPWSEGVRCAGPAPSERAAHGARRAARGATHETRAGSRANEQVAAGRGALGPPPPRRPAGGHPAPSPAGVEHDGRQRAPCQVVYIRARRPSGCPMRGTHAWETVRRLPGPPVKVWEQGTKTAASGGGDCGPRSAAADRPALRSDNLTLRPGRCWGPQSALCPPSHLSLLRQRASGRPRRRAEWNEAAAWLDPLQRSYGDHGSEFFHRNRVAVLVRQLQGPNRQGARELLLFQGRRLGLICDCSSVKIRGALMALS